MATVSIDPATVLMYENNLRHALQQQTSILAPTVTVGTMSGERKAFSYIGTASMVERAEKAQNTQWQDMNFSRRWVARKVFDFSVILDEFGDIASALKDPTSDILRAGVMAVKRKHDEIIIGAADATAVVGQYGTETAQFPTGNTIDVKTGDTANTGLNIAKLMEVSERMAAANVPEEDEKWFICTKKQIHDLLNDPKVSSADYNTVRALVRGELDAFMGFKFKVYNGLAASGDIRKCFAWTKNSMQLAVSADVKVYPPREVETRSFQPGMQVTTAIDAVRLFDEGVYVIPCAE
jgi:hypothetical protein